MKEIVFQSFSSTPQIGRLIATGPGNVTASQFDLPSEVQIVDKNQYIATLSEGSRLEMEFRVERNKGYHVVDRTRDDVSSVDFMQIDAIFMPVTKVNYAVEDALVDGSSAKDRLVLDIWTNGSIKPEEALSQAAGIVVDLFNPLKDLTLEAIQEDQPEDEDPTSQIPIEELQLSVRAYNCLKRAQINTVADLLDYSQEDLLQIKNFGQKSAEEVIDALQQRLGITLPQEKAKA
jgi:DNA-directed RNA polymerase subunit alpha